MVFSSLIFVFAFLPVQLLVYYAVPNKFKNCVLLLFSLIFYGFAGPVYILILLFMSLVSFLSARAIDGVKTDSYKDSSKKKKLYLFIDITILLLILIFFKYLAFGAECVNRLLGLLSFSQLKVPDIVLPIGISFYTFQLISYVVDVYRGNVKAANSFFKILLYASLFHQCIAGPIVRYETVANEIDERHVDVNDVFEGLFRFSIGLAKKALLANACSNVAVELLPESVEMVAITPSLSLWLGAVFYTLHIYLDFSAYSDMAIGMGRMAGFHYMENFNYPYVARSITDFWRRWHISLSTFFRDYVYIPLGGNRVKPIRHIINLLIVWALTGLWHGANYNFIIWGLYFFVFLIFEKYVLSGKEYRENALLGFLGNTIGRVATLIVIIVSWVIFKTESLDVLLLTLKGMFGLNNTAFYNLNTVSALKGNVYLLAVCAVSVTPLMRNIYTYLNNKDSAICKTALGAINIILPAVFILLSALALAGNSYNPFIYYRF